MLYNPDNNEEGFVMIITQYAGPGAQGFQGGLEARIIRGLILNTSSFFACFHYLNTNLALMELCGTSQDEHSTVSPIEFFFSKPAALCHLNVQSLMSKQDELELTLTIAQRPVIPGLSETWLDGSVTDAEVSVPCYATYRRDRGSRGGGVLVYVTDKVAV